MPEISPLEKTWVTASGSAETAALQNVQFILNVKKKTDGKWDKHKEVQELGKTGHMKKDNRRKKHVGRVTLQT